MSSTAATSQRRRVVLVDDHAVVRQGLAALVNEEPDFAVVGEAASPADALSVIADLQPDAAIIDITLGEGDGIALTREVKAKFPDVKVLVLSIHDESIYADRALRAGARGYMMKVEAADKLMGGLRRILDGDIFVSDRVAARMSHRVAGGADALPAAPIERLSNRELQIFQSIGKGMSVREIAASLMLSVKTIEAHREHVKQKLSIKSSRELLRFAIAHARVSG